MEAKGGESVVLGAGGPLGRAVAEELDSRAKLVTAVSFTREKSRPKPNGPIKSLVIDPLDGHALARACGGAGTIYICYEPGPDSPQGRWKEVTSNASLAAIESHATLVFANHLVNAESENSGLESEVLQAHLGGLTSTVVARFPQLIGRTELNPMVSMIFESVLSGKKAHWVGDPEVQRSMVDVGDAARAMVLLGETPSSHGRAWNAAPQDPVTGREFIELSFRAVGLEPNVGKWGRGIIMTGGVLARKNRDILQLPYDYYTPFVLDGREFALAFPGFRFTAAEESIAGWIAWYKDRGADRSG